MTGAIAHRGPDDEQFHIEPGVALGARRLSIIDLAGGRQPIANEDSSIWVAFNGELFEYPELRQDLLSRGHHLATRCDTEAWVHLYEDHREGMFARARGQFAVSLWDRNNAHARSSGATGSASVPFTTPRSTAGCSGDRKSRRSSRRDWSPPVPIRGASTISSHFSAPARRGHSSMVSSRSPRPFPQDSRRPCTKHCYWDLDFPDAGDGRRLDDTAPLVDELEALLQQSVERRLRSDVPVVSYISGGLDSTVLLGFCSRHRGEPIPAFTVGLDKAGPDERAHSTEAARVLGSPLTTVTMDRSKIAGTFPDLIRAAEGPVLDTSCAALLRLAQSVHRQGYKVALTGEGADEALAGYIWYKTQKIRDSVAQRIGPGPARLVPSS